MVRGVFPLSCDAPGCAARFGNESTVRESEVGGRKRGWPVVGDASAAGARHYCPLHAALAELDRTRLSAGEAYPVAISPHEVSFAVQKESGPKRIVAIRRRDMVVVEVSPTVDADVYELVAEDSLDLGQVAARFWMESVVRTGH